MGLLDHQYAALDDVEPTYTNSRMRMLHVIAVA
jgi:hypothetical protein